MINQTWIAKLFLRSLEPGTLLFLDRTILQKSMTLKDQMSEVVEIHTSQKVTNHFAFW